MAGLTQPLATAATSEPTASVVPIDGHSSAPGDRPEDASRVEALMSLIGGIADDDGDGDISVVGMLQQGCRFFDLELGLLLGPDEDGEPIQAMAGDLAIELSAALSTDDREIPSLSVERARRTTKEGSGQPAAYLHTSLASIELRTWLTCSVRGSSRQYGTLCFADRQPQKRRLDDDGRRILRFMAAWLATGLDGQATRQSHQEALAGKTAALERTNADLARLAHIASHDLQEPLRRIIGYCDLLKQDHSAELSDEAAGITEIIQSGGRQLRLIINDLVTYIRVREQLDHAFEPVDMFAVLHQVLEDLSADITASGAHVDIAHLPLVWGRAPLLKIVVHHLLKNALKHGDKTAPRIAVAVDDTGDFWQFALSDRGQGVAPRHADRIFEILERLHHKDEHGGSGTGLSICRLIIERCGGRIWLDPAYNEGARFLFTLPKDKPEMCLRRSQGTG